MTLFELCPKKKKKKKHKDAEDFKTCYSQVKIGTSQIWPDYAGDPIKRDPFKRTPLKRIFDQNSWFFLNGLKRIFKQFGANRPNFG